MADRADRVYGHDPVAGYEMVRLRRHKHVWGHWKLLYSTDYTVVWQVRHCLVSTCNRAEVESY